MKKVYLGINVSHGASASLMENGVIVAAVQEERFNKVKNFIGYPKKSIEFCLNYARKNQLNIDEAGFSTIKNPVFPFKFPLDNFFQIEDWVDYYGQDFYSQNIKTKKVELSFKKFKKNNKLDLYLNYNTIKSKDYFDNYIIFRDLQKSFLIKQSKNVIKKISFIDHHTCHAYYAAKAADIKKPKFAVLTLDSEGDGYNQTLWINQNNKLTKIYENSQCDLARIYRFVTLLLKMKPNEHEYKVMGLAPYSKNNYFVKCYNDVFKNILKVENCKIVHNQRPKDLYNFLQKKLLKYRFDNIAGAVQFFVENLTNKLIKQISKKYKINHFTISGGVSMNIKMNGNILKMKEVKGLFVPPCGTDDSLSIGACYYLNKENKQEQYLKNIYLGQELNKNKLTVKTVKKFIKNKYKFKIYEDYNVKKIAKLIHQGEIIAVAQGKEEFGARALGNRSIIANPSFDGVVEKINEQIKNRDFWMPFALTILNNKHKNFIKNEKNITSDFMTIGFDTLSKNYMKIKNGTHPYDKTVRPQILRKDFNDNYYRIIKEFYKISKIPAVLNTSLNLHGLPISSTLKEVINTFLNSGLRYLFLEGKILIKKI
mgnify:CR=1 FL=1